MRNYLLTTTVIIAILSGTIYAQNDSAKSSVKDTVSANTQSLFSKKPVAEKDQDIISRSIDRLNETVGNNNSAYITSIFGIIGVLLGFFISILMENFRERRKVSEHGKLWVTDVEIILQHIAFIRDHLLKEKENFEKFYQIRSFNAASEYDRLKVIRYIKNKRKIDSAHAFKDFSLINMYILNAHAKVDEFNNNSKVNKTVQTSNETGMYIDKCLLEIIKIIEPIRDHNPSLPSSSNIQSS